MEGLVAALAFAGVAVAQAAISVTPHEQYSSSIGVLGCKINTNRVAYWPSTPGCEDLCVKVSHQGRDLHLLHVDQSGGAYDVSYDAWNYLTTGKGAADDPTTGGGVAMTWERADMSACADLIKAPGGKLPLSAPNGMNFLSSCLGQPQSWVAKNYDLWNIADPVCRYGVNEECNLDLSKSNQPSCKHQLGVQTQLEDQPVYNLQYGTGKRVLAGQAPGTAPGSSAAISKSSRLAMGLLSALSTGVLWLLCVS